MDGSRGGFGVHSNDPQNGPTTYARCDPPHVVGTCAGSALGALANDLPHPCLPPIWPGSTTPVRLRTLADAARRYRGAVVGIN